MAHRPTMPTTPLLPGWGPLVEPPRRLHTAAAVLRWWWPTAVAASFLVLVAVVGGRDDPAPGLSLRGLATLTLAAAALTSLTIRRRLGPWALARALAEYAVLVLLVSLLTIPTGAPSAEPTPASSTRPPTVTQESASLPPGISQVVDAGRRLARAGRWLTELWDRAEAMTDPPPTRPQPTSGAPPPPVPDRPGGPAS
jgi:hypothetical protein